MALQPLRQWLIKSNIYEVNLRQYTPDGTIKAFMPHLPRLQAMGVEILWLMPVQPIAEKEKKGTMGSPYACADYTAVNPQLGTVDDFKALVAAVHHLKMKLIIDWVANHTGWDHRWTTEHKDWYKWDFEKNSFKAASGMEDIIELNYDNLEMVDGMINSMRWWIEECNIDGFRCDLAAWVRLSFWQEAKRRLQPLKPLIWLGEFDGGDHPQYMQVFDIAYTWTWMHRSKELYEQKADAGFWQEALEKALSAPPLQLWFTSNHDENSWNGTEYEKYGDAALLLAVLSAVLPGVPLVYSGQEVPNHKRLLFFEKDQIVWGEGEPLLQAFYNKLLELRKTHPVFHSGVLRSKFRFIETTNKSKVMAIERTAGEQGVLALFNFSEEEQTSSVPHIIAVAAKELFTEATVNIATDYVFTLPPWGYQVWVW